MRHFGNRTVQQSTYCWTETLEFETEWPNFRIQACDLAAPGALRR